MKQTIRLNERELHNLISESVKRVINESDNWYKYNMDLFYQHWDFVQKMGDIYIVGKDGMYNVLSSSGKKLLSQWQSSPSNAYEAYKEYNSQQMKNKNNNIYGNQFDYVQKYGNANIIGLNGQYNIADAYGQPLLSQWQSSPSNAAAVYNQQQRNPQQSNPYNNMDNADTMDEAIRRTIRKYLR